MKALSVPLSKEGYDPFIDFLKGVSILFVVLTHCLPYQDYILFSFWGAQAVPLFLLIQVFHNYKKQLDKNQHPYNFNKLWKRILRPFILLLALQIVLQAFLSGDLLDTIKNAIISGGIDTGSYYVSIYIQFFLLLPVLQPILRKIPFKYIILLFTSLSIIIELILSYTSPPHHFYRWLFIRYFYLIFLGYIWATRGIIINKLTIILSLISVAFIIIFQYANIKLEPFFFQNDWKIFHWISYFYTAYLFIFMLYRLYNKLGQRLKKICIEMGKYSYEIFLLQMFVFTFFPSLDFIGNIYIKVMLKITLTTCLSIVPVLLYKKLKYQIFNKL